MNVILGTEVFSLHIKNKVYELFGLGCVGVFALLPNISWHVCHPSSCAVVWPYRLKSLSTASLLLNLFKDSSSLCVCVLPHKQQGAAVVDKLSCSLCSGVAGSYYWPGVSHLFLTQLSACYPAAPCLGANVLDPHKLCVCQSETCEVLCQVSTPLIFSCMIHVLSVTEQV